MTTHSDVLTRLAALANSLKSLTGRQATLKGREAEALARAEIVALAQCEDLDIGLAIVHLSQRSQDKIMKAVK